MRFSDRKGLTKPRNAFQTAGIDEELRNGLWTAIDTTAFGPLRYQTWINDHPRYALIRHIWIHFFKRPLDEIDGNWPKIRAQLRAWFYDAPWYDVYNILEFISAELDGTAKGEFCTVVNSFLKRDMAAYRLIGNEVVEVTREEEVAVLEDAIVDTSPFASVNRHLTEALAKLTDRKAPDYRNAVKEAISAVEAMCQLISGDRATLGQALKKLSAAGLEMHPALERAWSSMYGYTSDEHGIRHALSEEPSLAYPEAKYMVVSCAAFVSFLISESARVGISLGK